jgi:outer membrane lipoprotein-sorting protein
MRSSSWRAAAVLVTLVLFAPAVHAQTVDEIVAKNIEAKGGFETLKNTTSVRTTGTGSMQGAELSSISVTKRPNFMRNELSMAGQTVIVGFDGETAWMSAGGMPAQAAPPGPQTDAMKQTSQIDSPLFDYKAKGTKIELGEPLTEGGRKLHHLIVTPKTGQPMHYYIDADTGLEAKMVIEAEDNGQKMTMEMRFSDFKTVEGRTVPFTISQFVNGNPVGEMKFQKIEFNVPLEDALFKMPKAG